MGVEEKAVEEGAKAVRAYLDPMLISPLSELGLLIKDHVSFWRFKNQVNIAIKAKAFLDKRGIDSRKLDGKITPSIVVPILESAGAIDDETLSEMFAKLLANSIDPSTASAVHPSFTNILTQLAPIDAKLMNRLYNDIRPVLENPSNFPQFANCEPIAIPMHRKLGYEKEALAQVFSNNSQLMNLSLENINRLGIADAGYNSLDRINKATKLYLTDFGLLFMKRCHAQ